ncbi:hypothetical protein HDU84_002657 [Entophlyctis sp. JEL0112]|nr:hypothetical protein HDU84_002657 [Entophlyctis sp. JEL0112]
MADTDKVADEKGAVEVPSTTTDNRLHRKLETRHLQMIALGGTIGTGLFLSSGATIGTAGPLGVLIAYSIVGVLVYSVVSALGEMATQVPVSGAFGELSTRFLDPAVGFTLGWNYYLQWLLTVPSELTALGEIPLYWTPDSQPWIFTLVALILLLGLNFLGVKMYGEVEYWLSFVKVVAIVIFIIIGFAVVCGANHDLGAIGFSNWSSANVEGAPIVSLVATFSVFTNAFYSYGGAELIGVTAGEAKNPKVSVPRAIRGTFWRIVLFYLISLLLIGMIIPLTDPDLSDGTVLTSPFTRVLQYVGIGAAADLMNAVILVAIFSAANGAIYASSRTLQSLAANKMAPAFLMRTTARGVPWVSMIITSFVGAIALIGAYAGNTVVFNFFINLLSVSTLVCWVTILFTHLNFRWAWRAQGRRDEDLVYRAPFFPYFDFVGIFIGLFVLVFFIYNAATTEFDVVYDAAYYVGLPLFIIPGIGYKAYEWSKTGKLQFGVSKASVEFDSSNNGGVYEADDTAELEFEDNPSLWKKILRVIA